MNDVAIRAFRTFAQGTLAVLVLIAVPMLNSMVSDVVAGRDILIDLNIWRSIGLAAIAGGAAAFISWLHNLLEEKTGHNIGPK